MYPNEMDVKTKQNLVNESKLDHSCVERKHHRNRSILKIAIQKVTILSIKIQIRSSSFQGHAYYGEYPLAFAAAFGHMEIYDYLIDHGADPNMQDSYGNTVLHVLVIRDRMVENESKTIFI